MLYVYENTNERKSSDYPFTICTQASRFSTKRPRLLRTRCVDEIDISLYEKEDFINILKVTLLYYLNHVKPSKIVDIRSNFFDFDYLIITGSIYVPLSDENFDEIYRKYLRPIIYNIMPRVKPYPYFNKNLISEIIV